MHILDTGKTYINDVWFFGVIFDPNPSIVQFFEAILDPLTLKLYII